VPRTPSRFLDDIPPELVEVVDLDAPRQGPPDAQEKNFFANLKERFKPKGAGGGAPGAPASPTVGGATAGGPAPTGTAGGAR
jgi:DNA helicase-2/ATP-dependent DNA helicase PcrA